MSQNTQRRTRRRTATRCNVGLCERLETLTACLRQRNMARLSCLQPLCSPLPALETTSASTMDDGDRAGHSDTGSGAPAPSPPPPPLLQVLAGNLVTASAVWRLINTIDAAVVQRYRGATRRRPCMTWRGGAPHSRWRVVRGVLSGDGVRVRRLESSSCADAACERCAAGADDDAVDCCSRR